MSELLQPLLLDRKIQPRKLGSAAGLPVWVARASKVSIENVDMMGSAHASAERTSEAPLVLHLEAPHGECE